MSEYGKEAVRLLASKMVCNDVPHRRREMEREREDPTALKFHTAAAAATTNNVDEAINFAVCLAEAALRRWAVHGAGKEINGSRAVNFSWAPSSSFSLSRANKHPRLGSPLAMTSAWADGRWVRPR